tara:strand:+ start:292 stop:1089 length:798 start_codon:yes stop_codon:yes gene_type:complete
MNKLISNLSFDEYQKLDGVNWSVLKHMEEPAVARYEMTAVRKQTDSMLLGSLVDAFVTTPKQVGSLFAQQPDDPAYRFTTNTGKEWKAEQLKNGITPVSRSLWSKAEQMAESVLAHPEVKDWLGFGMPQVSLQWEDKHGIWCRGMIDYVATSRGFVELKTTSADSQEKFGRDCFFRKYYGQLAFYRRGLRACGRETKDIRMIVVRSHAPYITDVFMPSYMMLDVGDELVEKMLDEWNIWKDREGDWKESRHETPVLDMPMWAYGT